MGWSIHHPVGLIHYTPTACYRGYTLFSTTHGGKDAYLIDMEGNVVHRWRLEEGITYAYLLDNGNLLCRIARPQDAGGAETLGASSGGRAGTRLGQQHRLGIPRPHAPPRLPAACPTATRSYLCGNLSPKTLWRRSRAAIEVDFALGMLGDLVREVTPSGDTVSEWRSWEFMDVDEEIICHLEPRHEWSHGNCVNVTADGDLLVSYRIIDTVGIVDRATGEFKWKWGPGEIAHPHHPTWLDSGRVLLFDNGQHRRGSSFSRVIEIDPETNEIHWEYEGSPRVSFYSNYISGAERLPNGNTLICEGAAGRLFEVTNSLRSSLGVHQPVSRVTAAGPAARSPRTPTPPSAATATAPTIPGWLAAT